MTVGVVRGFEPVHVDIGGHELSVDTPDAVDLAPDGGQSRAAATYSCELVGPGIFTVLGRLRAIFRRNLAVEAALCAIVCGDLAVIDGTDAAVRGIGALRSGPGTRVLGALPIARRAIARGSVEVTGRVIARFGLLVTQPGRDVAVAGSQPGLPAAHRRQLVRPGILAVLRGLRAILGGNLAVIDGPFAAVCSFRPTRVGARTFVCRAPAVARGAVTGRSIAITRGVVARFGLSIT